MEKQGFVSVATKSQNEAKTINIQMDSFTVPQADKPVIEEVKKDTKFEDDLDECLKLSIQKLANAIVISSDEDQEEKKEASPLTNEIAFIPQLNVVKLAEYDKSYPWVESIKKLYNSLLKIEFVDKTAIMIINAIKCGENIVLQYPNYTWQICIISSMSEENEKTLIIYGSKRDMEESMKMLTKFQIPYNTSNAPITMIHQSNYNTIQNNQYHRAILVHTTQIYTNSSIKQSVVITNCFNNVAAPLYKCVGTLHKRNNVAYEVKAKESYLSATVSRFAQQYGIIFCHSSTRSEEIRKDLAIHKIKSMVLGNANMDEVDTKWHNGEITIVICYNSITIPCRKDIKFIIEDTFPLSLERHRLHASYGGLDDRNVEVITLYSYNDRHLYDKWFTQADDNAKKEYYKCIQYCEENIKCRKVIIDQVADKCINQCDNCIKGGEYIMEKYNHEALCLCSYIQKDDIKLTLLKTINRIYGRKLKGDKVNPDPVLSKINETILRKIALELLTAHILYEEIQQYNYKDANKKCYYIKVDSTYLVLLTCSAIDIFIASQNKKISSVKKYIKVEKKPTVKSLPPTVNKVAPQSNVDKTPINCLPICTPIDKKYIIENQSEYIEINQRLMLVKEYALSANKEMSSAINRIFSIEIITNREHQLPCSISDLRMALQIVEWSMEEEHAFHCFAYLVINEIRHLKSYKSDHSCEREGVKTVETGGVKRSYGAFKKLQDDNFV